MSNNTTKTDSEAESFSSVRIVLIIVGVLLSSVSLYVLAALIVHRVRTSRRKKRELVRQQSEGDRRSVKRKESSTPWLDNLSLAAAVMAFLNCSSEHTVFYTMYTTNVACKVMQSFSFLFYAAGIACLYSFLWKRQRACYNSPTLAQMHRKVTRVLSAAILPVFLIMMVAGMALTAALWDFETSEIGCMEISSSRVPLIVLYTGSVAMQVALLILFVHPLKRHVFQKSTAMASDKILMALVKRSIITTGLCVAADTIIFVIAVALPQSTPFIVTNFLYDVNLLCNVLCVIGSFADWRQRIAPWCTTYKNLCDRRLPGQHLSSMKTSSSVV